MTNRAIPVEKNKKKTFSEEKGKEITADSKKALKYKKEIKKKPGRGDKNLRYRSLVIEGTKYRTLFNHKFENRKNWIAQDPNKVLSHLPGTVVKVFVSEGQQIEKGESILILEAMKMKNRIVFSKPGKVKAVYVSEGEKVPKDFIMVELE